MKKLQKEYIDYSIFNNYDENYFINALCVPIFEDEYILKLAICDKSDLTHIKLSCKKQLIFQQYSQSEIDFFLTNLKTRIELNNLAKKIIYAQKSDNSLELFFTEIIKFATKVRVSDIHLENTNKLCQFRFRIDGRIKTFFVFENKLFKYLSSYLKLISNLDITQTRLPMDSRFSFSIGGKNYDFRVSTMPTVHTESIVLRILDKSNIGKKLDNLGFNKFVLDELKKVLNLTQGLVLIAGPTGSGKTTTLYSLLKELNSDEKKIITVEDPVEYKLNNISQINVNNKIGLSFEIILKNILRQDPDIIFIGEIRDKFSLDIALQASLTGHLVLATIHANNSVQTITRLVDLKADAFLLSSTLKYVLSQRLVLKYCTNCNAKGCEKCNFTKYYDRTCICELLKIDDNISNMIFNKTQIGSIEEYMKDCGYKTLLEDGLQKVEKNITNIDEIYKVL